MRDALEPTSADPSRALLIENSYATQTGSTQAIVGIPGFDWLYGAGSGGVAGDQVQWVGQFTKTTGTQMSVSVCSGQIHKRTYGALGFTDPTTVITTANLTSASLTLSSTARVYCVTFFNKLFVTDGINTPFLWDGTTNGGLTKLSNCPVIFGQPVVHYSKVVGIKAGEPDVIVWSEEADATTGYEAGGFNNAWSLPGSKGERINALAASNDYLGILRPRSTTTVLGAINADFNTSGTRASVSEMTGAGGAGATLVLDEGVVTVDSDGRPQFWAKGVGYTQDPPMWQDCANTIAPITHSGVQHIQVAVDENSNLIWIGIPTGGTSTLDKFLLFERTGGVPSFVGTVNAKSWTGAGRIGVWTDESSVPHIVTSFVGGVAFPTVFIHGNQSDGPWSWNIYGTEHEIPHTVTAAHMGNDIAEEKAFSEFEIEVMLDTRLSDVTFSFKTPNVINSNVNSTDFALDASLYDVALWDVATYFGASVNTRYRIGTNEWGRWLLPTIVHDELNERFALIRCQAIAFRSSRYPEIP